MDSTIADERERARLARLEEQVKDMLANGRSFEQLVKEVDWHTFSDTKIETIQLLIGIRDEQPFKDNKMLQKLLNHYAIEHDNISLLLLPKGTIIDVSRLPDCSGGNRQL